MSELICLRATFRDEDRAATWIEILRLRHPELAGSIEEQAEELWIQGDRERASTRVDAVLWLSPAQWDELVVNMDELAAEGWPIGRRDRDTEERVAAGWRAQHPAIEVGSRLRIAPPWLASGEDEGGRREVVIEPGAAFGAGDHATTRLCLSALEPLNLAGARVADFGCGSGVLGLAALALGAASVVAVDREPAARIAAAANAVRNGEEGRFRVGGAGPEDLGPGPFELILANIFGGRLLELLPDLRRRLSPGGTLILGGLLAEHEAPLLAALAEFPRTEILRRSEFAAILARAH
jgi:ribosomal protein L11 methyltransferase